MHIEDIDVESFHSFVSSFADDTRAASEIESMQDHTNLQKDLESIYKWSQENNMMFNNDKCPGAS